MKTFGATYYGCRSRAHIYAPGVTPAKRIKKLEKEIAGYRAQLAKPTIGSFAARYEALIRVTEEEIAELSK